MKWLKNIFKKKPEWIYGTVKMTFGYRIARKHRKKGNVQFIFWKAGEHGHKEDFWCDMDSYWWPLFVPDEAIPTQITI